MSIDLTPARPTDPLRFSIYPSTGRHLKHLATLAARHGDGAADIIQGAMDDAELADASAQDAAGGGSVVGGIDFGGGASILGVVNVANNIDAAGRGGSSTGVGSGGGRLGSGGNGAGGSKGGRRGSSSSSSSSSSSGAASSGGSFAISDAACGYEAGAMPPSPLELEIVMETLADLCAEPTLFLDLFVNYDCDLARDDILESMVVLLSSCARSPSPALAGGLRVLCMEALLNGLKAMQTRTANAIEDDDENDAEDADDAITAAAKAALSGSGAGAAVAAAVSSSSSSSSSSSPQKHPLWQRKLRKRQLKAGALLFNDKARSGLQSLQKAGLLPDPLTPEVGWRARKS